MAGGMSGPFINSSIATVEVMDAKTLAWSTVASLPHPYTGASGTICGDQLYMLGGSSDKKEMTSVLTCSLIKLATTIINVIIIVNGELLAVGGHDKDDKPSSAIHKYNPTTNSWDLINNMLTARYNCLIATIIFPTGRTELNIIGGETSKPLELHSCKSRNCHFSVT